MKLSYLPSLIFICIFLSFFPLSLDYATSVVPGWHTSIFPPYFIWQSIVVLIILLVSIAYWKLSTKNGTINWIFFIVHFILTIPAIIYLKYGLMIFNSVIISKDELLIPITFVLGQILFIVHYVRSLQRKRIY
jgi:hypothetical protein